MATKLPPSRGPQSGEDSKWPHNPRLFGVPRVRGNQNRNITGTFSRTIDWAEINTAT